MKAEIETYTIYVFDYNGSADQDFGDDDVMVVTVDAAYPEDALEIARCERQADWEEGESDIQFCGYCEKSEVPDDALVVD